MSILIKNCPTLIDRRPYNANRPSPIEFYYTNNKSPLKASNNFSRWSLFSGFIFIWCWAMVTTTTVRLRRRLNAFICWTDGLVWIAGNIHLISMKEVSTTVVCPSRNKQNSSNPNIQCGPFWWHMYWLFESLQEMDKIFQNFHWKFLCRFKTTELQFSTYHQPYFLLTEATLFSHFKNRHKVLLNYV